MRSISESWKSFLWKEAICLKHSTPSRPEMLPSVFSLPRCIASSKYLSIKWQTYTVARELLFSGKAQLRGKLWQSDIRDLNEEGCCFGLSMFCNASVVFFHARERYIQLQTLMLWSGFSLDTNCIYNTSSHRPKLHLENMRDVPQPTIIYISRQGKTDKRLLKKRQIHPTSVISWDNISTLCNM